MRIGLAVGLTGLLVCSQGIPFQARPKPLRFDVVSINPCAANAPPGNGSLSPGRLLLSCVTAETMMRTAFLSGSVRPHELEALVKGGPSWIRSSRFTIEGVTEKPTITRETQGQLILDVLQRRFKLKAREETQPLKVFHLVQEPGGAKLKPTKEGSCFQLLNGPPPPGTRTICGGFTRTLLNEVDVNGSTMDNLCTKLSYALERDVIDKTGLPGIYDFHLQTRLEELSFYRYRQVVSPQSDDEPSGSVFTALRKLGLRLITSTRPSKIVIIDHIELPDAN